jgi:transposase
MPFPKQIIKQAVAEVEAGARRAQVCQKYGMASVTLDDWLARYGSQEYQLNKRKHYTIQQKKNVVKAILSRRMTIHEANVAYGVKGRDTVKRWIREYQKELTYLKENPEPDSDTRKLSSVEEELKAANLRVLALETMIDVAEEELQIKIRKKRGAKQSAN